MSESSDDTFTVRPPSAAEIGDVQAVFNHREIIGPLGGFTMKDGLTDKIKRQLGLWGAVDDATGAFVGAAMLGGRSQVHLLKYGSVGVVPEHRRRRVGTALYLAMTAQGLLEGRRVYEDTIVGDNLEQFQALPQLGIVQAGELRHRTASAKSICLFQCSLLDPGQWERMLARLPGTFTVEVRENSHTDECWARNMALAAAHPFTGSLPARMAAWRVALKADPRFRVVRGDDFVRPHKARPAGVAPRVKRELFDQQRAEVPEDEERART
jgi:hypothetical protein